MDAALLEEILTSRFHEAQARLRDVPREQVVQAIAQLVERHGRFPASLAEQNSAADDEVMVGPQVRQTDEGGYVVANCEFWRYTGQPPGTSSLRRFDDLQRAVECYVMSELPSTCAPRESSLPRRFLP